MEGELRDGAVDEDEDEANREDGDGAEGAEGAEARKEGEEGDAGEKQELGEEEGGEGKREEKKKRLPKEVRNGVNKYVYYVCSYGECLEGWTLSRFGWAFAVIFTKASTIPVETSTTNRLIKISCFPSHTSGRPMDSSPRRRTRILASRSSHQEVLYGGFESQGTSIITYQ